MDSWSTKDWTNAPTVFISSSETLYCTSCSVYLNHDISDGRIGSLNWTKAYLFVCEELIKNTKGYIQEQELKSRWRKEYNQLKEFNSMLTEYINIIN